MVRRTMNRALKTLLAAALACAAAAGAPLAFRTRDLPLAAVHSPYREPVVAVPDVRCAEPDIGLSLAGGRLPRGLELEGGFVAGVPTETGRFHFSIRAANGCGEVTEELIIAVTGKPVLRAMPRELVFDFDPGSPAPDAQSVLVRGTWRELPYSATASAPWLAVKARDGVIPGQDSGYSGDTVSVRVSPDKLESGTYRATVEFSAWQAAESESVTVVLRVFPKLPPLLPSF